MRSRRNSSVARVWSYRLVANVEHLK
jgi:hypothetical protein